MQTKKHSLIESVTNTTIGFLISLLVQLIIYPLLGIEVRFDQNIIITFVFTIVSILRGYIIRRFFNRI
jgi:predicted membrane protein